MTMTPRIKNMTARINRRREPTVAAGFARALLDLAVSKGADRETLVRRAGLDLKDLADQDSRVPFAQYVALMRAGKALSGDGALALHFGEAFAVDELSIVGLIGNASGTMADAFAQMNRYARLVIEVEGVAQGDRYVLSRENGELWMIDTRQNPNDFPELTESSFARMVCSARRFGNKQFVKAIQVTHAAPPWRAEYDRIFPMPVTFASNRNALLMTDDSWMAIKTPAPSRYMFGILSAHADALLKSLEDSTTTRGRVESLLMPILHTGDTGMDVIAARMALSRQTLLRRLKEEGTTFAQVLDELRHKLALDYLRGRKVSVNETAYLTGFSDVAAFSRAFKRWTGARPGRFAAD